MLDSRKYPALRCTNYIYYGRDLRAGDPRIRCNLTVVNLFLVISVSHFSSPLSCAADRARITLFLAENKCIISKHVIKRFDSHFRSSAEWDTIWWSVSRDFCSIFSSHLSRAVRRQNGNNIIPRIKQACIPGMCNLTLDSHFHSSAKCDWTIIGLFLVIFVSFFPSSLSCAAKIKLFFVEDKCMFPGRTIELSIRTFVQAWITQGGGSTYRRRKNRVGDLDERLRSRESPVNVRERILSLRVST